MLPAPSPRKSMTSKPYKLRGSCPAVCSADELVIVDSPQASTSGWERNSWPNVDTSSSNFIRSKHPGIYFRLHLFYCAHTRGRRGEYPFCEGRADCWGAG